MNIIITGASRGIGYELVKLFSAKAENSVMAVARSTEKLLALKKECSLAGAGKVIPFTCDLRDLKAIEELRKSAAAYFGSVDILINNAGAIVNKPFADISAEDLQYVYNVNVFSVVHLLQKLIPIMNQQERSHVVNISSMGGFQGSAKFAGLSAYSSSKAALASLTECLAEEYKESNIAFNCLALGAAQTEMLSEAFPGYKAPISAAQMAAFIADFASGSQKYMNGKIIPVSMSTP